MKAEELEGRVNLLVNATQLRFPNCLVIFEVEYLTNEKQLYIYGDDAIALAVTFGADLKVGKDGYYICLPSFVEGMLMQMMQRDMKRTVYKFTDILPVKKLPTPPNNDFTLN